MGGLLADVAQGVGKGAASAAERVKTVKNEAVNAIIESGYVTPDQIAKAREWVDEAGKPIRGGGNGLSFQTNVQLLELQRSQGEAPPAAEGQKANYKPGTTVDLKKGNLVEMLMQRDPKLKRADAERMAAEQAKSTGVRYK